MAPNYGIYPYTPSAFPAFPTQSRIPSSSFNLNPRAAPFLPGATSHPPTLISPNTSENSTVLQATPRSAWVHFAPRVPVSTGQYGYAGGAVGVAQDGYGNYTGAAQGGALRSGWQVGNGYRGGGFVRYEAPQYEARDPFAAETGMGV